MESGAIVISLKSKYLISLIVFSYGFALERNPYDNLKLRVIVGTEPESAIEKATDLLPTDKILADVENLDMTTEVLAIYPHKLSAGKLS